MKLGIVGGGVVGRATARAYLEHALEVRVHDIVPERSTHPIDDVLACDLVMICLPESAVEEFFSGHAGSNQNFVIRSTVPIGTTRRLAEWYELPNLVHSPEFLTSRCAVADAQMPARNIIGYPRFGRLGLGKELQELYKQRFPGVPLHCMTSDESEAVKLFQNAFFAAKVAFWNECRTLADHHGLDWRTVMDAILADGRISPSHTQVPGPDGKRGFGGSCLQKDLDALIGQFDEADVARYVTWAAQERNRYDRAREP